MDLTKIIRDLEQENTSLGSKVVELTEENLKLKQELEHTKELLVSNTPLLGDSSIEINKTLSNVELIALEQINLLKELALRQELTYDQCKKVTEYHKLLTAAANKNKPKEVLDKVPTDNLIDFINKLEKKS